MPNTITIRKPVFVLIHFRERFQKYTDSMKTISVLVWTVGLTVAINHGSNVEHCFAVLACSNVQIRYIHGALRSGYATMHNATIQKTTFFELGVYFTVEHCVEKHYE